MSRTWISRLPIAIGLAVGALPSAAAAQANLGPINLAVHKQTSQSSEILGAGPDLAVDGNTDGNFWDGSVTHTDYEDHPWWQVDLGEERQIGRVEIANRTDCCGDRLTNFMVLVADFPLIDTDITDADTETYPGVMRTFVTSQGQANISVPINRGGRYVRIALVNANYLSLAEVQVIEAENAARGRVATQSTTSSGAVASRAVDGNTDGAFVDGSMSSTAYQAGSYWTVDLGLQHDIREIDIWSTNTDCCSAVNPRPQVNVYVSALPLAHPFDPSLRVATVNQAAPAVVPFVDRRGRYVAIEVAGTDALSLAEVQVFPWARGSVGGHVSSSYRPSTSTLSSNVETPSIDFRGSTSFTNYQAGDQPFWDLDLGAERYLETFKLWFQAGSTPMSTFHLFASDKPFVDSSGKPITQVQALVATPGVSHWIGRGVLPVTAISTMRQARFLRVQLDGTAQVSFNEAEIVTTEGFVINTLVVETGLLVNGSVDPNGGGANPPNGDITVDPPARRVEIAGHFPRPNTRINMYAFTPNATGAGGTYSLFASAMTGTTPELTGYSAAPQYLFDIPDIFFPGPWPVGGMGDMLVSADDNYGFTPTPIRSINNDGSEHVFWPDIRFPSANPSPNYPISWPDGSTYLPATATTYLDLPMHTNAAAGYPVTNLIPTTVAAFKSKYGITASSSTHAGYYNAGDLGIGRDMYCRKPTGYTVCLVDNWARVSSNHTPIFGDPVGAGGSQAVLAATVVMVKPNYSSTLGGYPPVAFGAYDFQGNRLNNIALDQTGARTQIPNNCMTCHGGTGVGSDGNGHPTVARAYFLPFDLAAFQDRGSYKLADQQEQFYQLNMLAYDEAGQGPPPAMQELVNGWYPFVNGVQSHTFNGNFIPSGWSRLPGDARVYTDVIKPYCRTCHLTQETGRGGIDFASATSAEDFRALILAYVCNMHAMPHAYQTMERFWASGARAQLLGFYGRNDVPKCDH